MKRVLSSIDHLPEECEDDIVWAMQELAARRRTQADILFEFNDRLAVKGAGPISRSAFSRHSVRLSAAQRRIAEGRAMFAGLRDQFDAGDVDENTVILGEFIKTAIQEVLVDSDALSPKAAMELARAYASTVSAQKASAERRRAEDEARDKRDRMKKAVDAVEAAVADANIGPDGQAVLKRIREEVYGIFDRPEAP